MTATQRLGNNSNSTYKSELGENKIAPLTGSDIANIGVGSPPSPLPPGRPFVAMLMQFLV